MLEERESADQIILGSMDWKYCLMVCLGRYLEHALLTRDEDGCSSMFRVKKELMWTFMNEITIDENYSLVLPGPISIHSIRKLPATYGRRNSCTKDDVDARGRWKSNKRIVDTYIDCVIPYPDIKVASTLSIGGLANYVVRNNYKAD